MNEPDTHPPAISTALPLQVRKLDRRKSRERCASVLGLPTISAPPSPRVVPRSDPIQQLNERIDVLEQKIDMIMTVLMRQHRREIRDTAVPLELSARTIAFDWADPLDPEQPLEIDMTLSVLPLVEVSTVAEVLCCEPLAAPGEDPAGYRVTARFVAISESDQDSIHRFVLTTQRTRRRARPLEGA